MLDRNRVELSGTLVELPVLRHSPAGVPIQACVISHQSQQHENGATRRVVAEVEAMAIGEIGIKLGRIGIGKLVRVSGFIVSANQKQARRLVLHIDEFELLN
ncbi:primosomal replication protein N [Andreprevotia chitinilytica]|uniref:primosomal replication protein N n=1 Tax=Andreprevotia chitinilytica TaxID=396808 RepID=UPI000A023842|nr:primosomal replication protein N [Andreprevotia chitinilytica]